MLNIIIVSVADFLMFLFILDICRLDIHSFRNPTALLPVLVRCKSEIVYFDETRACAQTWRAKYIFLSKLSVGLVTVLLVMSHLI